MFYRTLGPGHKFANLCYTFCCDCEEKKMCGILVNGEKQLLWNSAELSVKSLAVLVPLCRLASMWGMTYLIFGADTVCSIFKIRIHLKQSQKRLWRPYDIHTQTKADSFSIFMLDNKPSVCPVHSGWLWLILCDNNIEKTATCSPSSALSQL